MGKTIKNFKVWHPPKDIVDEPTRVYPRDYDESLTSPPVWDSFLGIPYRKERGGLTETGWLWMVLPWVFWFYKKLQCSLLEFMIFIVAWGITSGALLQMATRAHFDIWQIIITLYFSFHISLMIWSAVLYEERIASKSWRGPHFSAAFWAVLTLGVWTVLVNILVLSKR